MIPVYSAESIRAAEAPLLESLPSGVLMQRAAYGLSVHVATIIKARRSLYGAHVVLLVGAGNNGGDALWCGAFLQNRGVHVTALLLSPDHTHQEAREAFLRAAGTVLCADPQGLPQWKRACQQADLAVDGIVGIGGHGPLRPAAVPYVREVEGQNVPIVSVDIPSGVEADTGEAYTPRIRPTATVTFGALKPCHVLNAPACGDIHLVDIGLQWEELTPAQHPVGQVLTDEEVSSAWPRPTASDDKYSIGVVGICAGSEQYPGAALLCVAGAVHSTSGMVRYTGGVQQLVLSHYPECVCSSRPQDAGRVHAWVMGPGVGTDKTAYEHLQWLQETGLPLLVDADGLTVLSQNLDDCVGKECSHILLTPHSGEFLRLCSALDKQGAEMRLESQHDIEQEGRCAVLRRFRSEWERVMEASAPTVLLKGRATVICGPNGILMEDTGSSWAATPGSGDVLAGLIGAVMAQGSVVDRPLEESAAMAVRAHSRAAAYAAQGVPTHAYAIAQAIPDALRGRLASGIQ